MQKEFFKKLSNSILSYSKYDKKLLLLSSGVDSLLLCILLKELYFTFDAVTIVGESEKEGERAKEICDYYGIYHRIYKLNYDDIVNNLDVVKNKGFTTVESVMEYISYYLMFNYFQFKNTDIFWGEGANRLYGSLGWATYVKTKDIMKEKNVNKETAQNILRKEYYNKTRKKPIVDAFKVLLKANNLIMPYTDKTVEYINDITYSIIQPETKKFIKIGLKELYKVPDYFLKVDRTIMQIGTGYYYSFKKDMIIRFGSPKKALNCLNIGVDNLLFKI